MGKLAELDAVRGIAALVVFNQHYFNSLTMVIRESLRPTPLFAFCNGASAVMLFFVLSGFVLTLQPLRSGQVASLAAPAVRRWPRLAGPVVVAGVFYVVATKTGAFPKLSWFHGIGARFPLGLFWGREMGDGDFGPVLEEAAFGTFIYGSAVHSNVLWSMTWELRGSFLAFAFAGCLLTRMRIAAKIALLILLSGLGAYDSIWLVGFPFGVAGAVFHIRFGDRVRLPLGVGGSMLILALLVLSWNEGHGAGMWVWTSRLSRHVQSYLWAVCEALASLSVMGVALYCFPVRQLLRTAPARLLGVLSFPLYLTNMLTILSVGAWLCYALFPGGAGVGGAIVLYVPVLGASLLVSWPLVVFDRVWISWVSGGSGEVIGYVKKVVLF
jgi:peptidoglycan/LPS O-acetylase OafA/YrhL